MKKLSLFIVIIAFCGLNEAIGQWNTNGSSIYNTNSGNVGIGNSAPSTLLHVAKNMTEPTITVQNLGGIGGATYTMMDNVSGANWKFKATNTGGFKIRDHATGLDVFVIEKNSAVNLLYLKSGGNIGIGTATPVSSALVDMTSTTKGFLPPRMTSAQLNAISNPADGLLIYCIDCGLNGIGAMSMFLGGVWYSLSLTNCIIPPSAPAEGIHVPSDIQIIWNWNPVSGATGYKWNTTNDFASAEEMLTATTKTETGLNSSTTYDRFVWAYNACGNSTSTMLTETTLASSGEWIHWDDGVNSVAIGTNGEVEFDVAARWEPAQLLPYDGNQVEQIAFFPDEAAATYKVRVWTGGTIAGPANIVVDQTVTNPVIGAWNYVILTTPVPIDISKDLWIGYYVNTTTGYPAGCDNGPAVDGYGNMMNFGGWLTLLQINPGLDYNWNIQALIGTLAGENIMLRQLPSLNMPQTTIKSDQFQKLKSSNVGKINDH